MKKIYRNTDKIGKILLVASIIFAILGDGFGFYKMFFWWDLLTHFTSGICFVSIGLGIARCAPDLKLRHMIFFGFAFAVSVHVAWELFEFICDLILDLNMQRWRFDPRYPDTYGKIINVRTPGVIDTMTDFAASVSASLLTSAAYLLRSKGKK